MALVDIIIPTRNNASVLRKCLESIAKQNFLEYQCYIVDDCSKDETVKMVKLEFVWVKILKSNKHRGPSQNRNLAIKKGNAPFIVIVDDDVTLNPDWLKEMVDFISLSPAIGAVGSQLRFWHSQDVLNGIGGFFGADGLGTDLFFNIPLEKVKGIIEQPTRIVYACSAAMIMRRCAFERAGGFNPLYFYMAEDFDLGLRINWCGYLVVYNPKAIAYHRYHKTADTFPKDTVDYLYYRNCLLTILKNFSVHTIENMLPKLILRLRRDKLIGIKCFIWNLFHLGDILKWKRYIRKHRLINESQILALNSYLSSLRSDGISLKKGQTAGLSWRRHLWEVPFRVYGSLNRCFQKPHKEHSYVDNIIFLVTNLCNADCQFCFLRHQLNKDVEKNLTLGEIEKFFSSLGRVNNIVLGGGEPFLRKDLDRICMALERVSKPTLFTIPTNGFSPDIIFKKVKTILENTHIFLKISLSIDGPPQIHDDIRKFPGLFAKVKETYQKLLFLYHIFYPRLELQVNSTIFAQNYPHFLELYYLIKEKFRCAEFVFETIRGHYDTSLVKPITDEMYSDLIESIRQIGDTDIARRLELHNLALQTLRQRTQVVRCNAGANFIVLDFWGNLYPCEILPSFVNIRDIDYDFAQVVKDPRWNKVIENIQKGKCYCTHMCFLVSSLSLKAIEKKN